MEAELQIELEMDEKNKNINFESESKENLIENDKENIEKEENKINEI
jgi:hypothetical protein